MGEQPRESEPVQPGNWRRAVVPLLVVVGLAAVVCRRDVHLSWTGTALVLVVIVAATSVYWRFVTHKVLPSLTGRRRTWRTRSGRLKVTVTCRSCGNSADLNSGQGSCPSCGRELGHSS
jgi:hypothetical protein